MADDPRLRLGVYAAPRPDSPLGARAARWFDHALDLSGAVGPDPEPSPVIPGLGYDDWRDLTAEPVLYGFHATLTAPFRPAEGTRSDEVDAVVADIAAQLAPVLVPRLVPAVVRGCAVLVPSEVPEGLLELERRCVTELARLRRPLEPMDLARRRRAGLTARQDELLLAVGYPWALDEFEFHMTLTRRLRPAEVGPVLDAATAWFAPVLDEPYLIDDLCLVAQAGPGEPFAVASRHRLAGSPEGGGH